jgi:AcrR family transcriptional regulator
MVIKQRAISDQQKEERRRAILTAGLELYQETSYEAVNIAQVAQKAGVAKGTFYLYFKTKEELFLAMLAQEFVKWFDQIDTGLTTIQTTQGTCSIDEFIAGVGATLENRSTLIRLIAILHAVLEQNIDFDTAYRFKQMLLVRIAQTGALTEAVLSFLKPDEGVFLMLHTYALIIGVQQLAEPAPIVRQVIEEKDLQDFQVDFMDYFLTTLKIFLNGLQARG